MERPNNFETTPESNSDSRVNFVKSFLRMAPVLASVLAMSACSTKELDKCQIEIAGIQGALEGVGVKHEAPKVDDLQACKIEKAKLDGIMESWKLMHPDVAKPKIEKELSESEKQIRDEAKEAIKVADELPPLSGSEPERIEMPEEPNNDSIREAPKQPKIENHETIPGEQSKEGTVKVSGEEIQPVKFDAAEKYREDFKKRVKVELERRRWHE